MHDRSSARRTWVGLALACAFVALASLPLHRPSSARASAGDPPSIVLILTDDQRWDTLDAMPHVRHALVERGVDFRRAFVVNPSCCPSRTSILTGKYSHSTGVYTNTWPYGGFGVFETSGGESSTVATWLHDAGYRTALIGKYLNEYRRFTSGVHVAPGWDRWFVFDENGGGAYYGYKISDQGQVHQYNPIRRKYSTSVLTRQAVSFIHRANGPLFLYYAPSAPHGPAHPAPRDRDAFRDLRPYRPPSYSEPNVSDKPAWVRSKAPFKPWREARIDRFRRHQYQTLVSVDRGVDRIVDALRATGRLDNTMIVFMSDNGYLWGEHRLVGKFAPYEESIRVPFVVRYDPLTTAPSKDRHLVLNIDLAPTFAQLAGVQPPAVEGSSVIPLLESHDNGWRNQFLIEHVGGRRAMPTYCALRTKRYMYAVYAGMVLDEEELYDLSKDPYELDNRATDPRFALTRLDLRDRLRQLCQPPPPGYSLIP